MVKYGLCSTSMHQLLHQMSFLMSVCGFRREGTQ